MHQTLAYGVVNYYMVISPVKWNNVDQKPKKSSYGFIHFEESTSIYQQNLLNSCSQLLLGGDCLLSSPTMGMKNKKQFVLWFIHPSTFLSNLIWTNNYLNGWYRYFIVCEDWFLNKKLVDFGFYVIFVILIFFSFLHSIIF